MKSKLLKALVLTFVLASIASVSVFAGKKAELKVFVRNHTGAPVEIRLTDKSGNTNWMSVADGVNQANLTEGKYEYYATTACGTDMGTWNLNVSKQLDINCTGEKADLSLEKRCPDNLWGKLWIQVNDAGHPIAWSFVWYDNFNKADVAGGNWIEGDIICRSDLWDDHWGGK